MLTIYGQICCWRFFLGTGVGGEYPLAATVTSESSSAGKRGSLMSAVFAMQGVGSLVSGIVVITCLYLGLSTAFTWRFALAFGAVPPLLAFPYRLRMHETETFERVRKERAAQQLHNEMMAESEKNPIAYDHLNERSSLIPSAATAAAGNHRPNPSTTSHGTFDEEKPGGTFVRLPDGRIFYHEIPSTGGGPLPQQPGSEERTTPRLNTVHPSGFASGNGPAKNTATLTHDSSYDQFHDLRSRNTSTASLTSHGQHGPSTSVPPEPESPRWMELKRAFTYYRWHMLGTALCWFLLDVDFYANGLFNHEVTATILKPPSNGQETEHTTAMQDAINSVIISLIGIPGYLLSVFFIDTVGRKNLQILGFCMMACLFFTCGIAFDYLLGENATTSGKYLFMLIYSLTFLFSNFGPNTTTFVIPGEIYPTEVRATCHGLSAACGKLGAATGAYFFPLLLGPQGALNPTADGMKMAMIACGIVGLLGAAASYFLTPNYDSNKLEDETYLELDFSCLRPSAEEMRNYDSRSSMAYSASENEMLQVVHSAHDYAMDSWANGNGGAAGEAAAALEESKA
eukprot:scaffold967_cov173-Ochromonas_danica.AAC.28